MLIALGVKKYERKCFGDSNIFEVHQQNKLSHGNITGTTIRLLVMNYIHPQEI